MCARDALVLIRLLVSLGSFYKSSGESYRAFNIGAPCSRTDDFYDVRYLPLLVRR
jgi:hypothetical protein